MEAEDARLAGIQQRRQRDAVGGRLRRKSRLVSGHSFGPAAESTGGFSACRAAACTARVDLPQAHEQTFDVAVQYFDLHGWRGSLHARRSTEQESSPGPRMTHFVMGLNGDNSTRFTCHPRCPPVGLKPGDVLRVEGVPDGNDPRGARLYRDRACRRARCRCASHCAAYIARSDRAFYRRAPAARAGAHRQPQGRSSVAVRLAAIWSA